jgi:hypothetical protein
VEQQVIEPVELTKRRLDTALAAYRNARAIHSAFGAEIEREQHRLELLAELLALDGIEVDPPQRGFFRQKEN